MAKRIDLSLPKEHGAWAMLFVPLAVGSLVARRFNAPVVLVILSATFVFIGRDSLLDWWRAINRKKTNAAALRALLIYFGLASVAALPLLVVYHLNLIAAFGLMAAILLGVNTAQATNREDRSILGEVLAICGLTLGAPAVYYAATSRLDTVAALLWTMCALFFTSSVFYVKFRVGSLNRRREDVRRRSWRNCAGYHAMLVVTLVGLWAAFGLKLFALVAFVPVLARSFWYLAKPEASLNLRRIGLLEIIYSVVFLVFVTLGLPPV